jgi:GTP-binding protein LepA
LEIVAAVNKVDLPNADAERTKNEIEEVIGLEAHDAILCSAKTGQGVIGVLEDVIRKVPPPEGDENAPLQALIFDSWYDSYQGVIMLVRVFNGVVKKGDRIRMMSTQKEFEVTQVGAHCPQPVVLESLSPGEVGFVIAGIKEIRDTKIGDTITGADHPATKMLKGFRDVKPMVFTGIYPTQPNLYEDLKESLEKLRLNDASFTFEPETSAALGFGFRCGFLGLLHIEIVQERLEREFNASLITTAPTVVYHVHTTQGEVIEIDNPSKMPDPTEIDHIEEPYVNVMIPVPAEYVGTIIQLCEAKRGLQKKIDYITKTRAVIYYEMPFPEVMFDFYDKLKTLTRGYASLDYEMCGYKPSDLVKLNIMINGDVVDALSIIVYKESAYYRGRTLVQRLRSLIPRQQFEIAIQAAIGGRIVARESVKALRKDVLAKCYGGDITRKRKLLEKQKEGKKRMKQVGSVEIPQEAFLAALKIE